MRTVRHIILNLLRGMIEKVGVNTSTFSIVKSKYVRYTIYIGNGSAHHSASVSIPVGFMESATMKEDLYARNKIQIRIRQSIVWR